MIEQQTYETFRDLLMEKSGLVVGPDKTYLLESRLLPLGEKYSAANLNELARKIHDPAVKSALIKDIVEAMTTNETSFFRDKHPFERFTEVILPKVMEQNQASKRIKIWCAAASSGQEPYSIAMSLKENMSLTPDWRVEIVATDIDDKILEQAKRAEYSQFEVQRGLPISLLVKYFNQNENTWKLNDDIKRMVSFRNFNLLDTFHSLSGPFDIIFCRNVLIYFDRETKGRIFQKMSDVLADDGLLFLGGAETTIGITEAFKPMPGERSIYIKNTAV